MKAVLKITPSQSYLSLEREILVQIPGLLLKPACSRFTTYYPGREKLSYETQDPCTPSW